MSGILCAVSAYAASCVTLGLEEEVFITTPTRPTLDALYALAKLLGRNPRYYYKHTASNFARGRDARQCLMSSVEIATRPHAAIDALLGELRTHRAALADAAGDAYLVPVGHLFDLDAPTNTAGLHIHIGAPAERRHIVYANLAHFLPLLILLSASSPYAGGRYFGNRIAWRRRSRLAHCATTRTTASKTSSCRGGWARLKSARATPSGTWSGCAYCWRRFGRLPSCRRRAR
jgi:hypothetical protein